ncbi:hypothetical protein, partial [Micromonospora fulviviridis]
MRQQPEQDPPRVTSRTERVWQIARPALELAALMAAYNQREGLAVAAKALAVLGRVSWILGCGSAIHVCREWAVRADRGRVRAD